MRRRRELLVGLGVATVAALAAQLWVESRPAVPNVRNLDLFHFFVPAHAYVGDELARGRLPSWDPYIGLGASAVTDPQLGIWYPPNLLVAVLPTAEALDLLALFHVLLAATGAWVLCRRAGIGIAGAAVATVLLATGPPFQTLAAWPAIQATFAWCPLAIVLGQRAAERPGLPAALGLAAVFALQVLAGYFQLHLYTVGIVALFACFAASPRPGAWMRVLCWIVVAEALGLALSALQLVPSLSAVKGSIRSPAFMKPWFYEILPVHLADYRRSLAAYPDDATIPVFGGVLGALLALAGVLPLGRRIPLRRPVVALGIVAVVLSLGSATPAYPLLWRTPVANWFTGPYKWTFIAGMVLALSAAIGNEALFGTGRTSRRGRIAWAVLGALVLAALPYSRPARVVGVCGLVAGVLGTRAVAAMAPVAVGLAVLGSLGGHAMRPSDSPTFFTRYRPAYEAVASQPDAGRVFSILPSLIFSLRQGDIERIPTFNTYETLLPIRSFELHQAIGRTLEAPTERKDALSALRALGVRYLLCGQAQGAWLERAGLRRIFTSPEVQVWDDPGALPRAYLARRAEMATEAAALKRVFDPTLARDAAVLLESEEGPSPSVMGAGSTTTVSDDPAQVRVVVEAETPAVLVLLDAWSPEWQATMDGAPVAIRHANYLGRAVEVPAGRHEVAFRFVSRPFRLGVEITLAALAAYLVLLWYASRGRLRPHGDSPPGLPPAESPATR
jgi:hypothetical protein